MPNTVTPVLCGDDVTYSGSHTDLNNARLKRANQTEAIFNCVFVGERESLLLHHRRGKHIYR